MRPGRIKKVNNSFKRVRTSRWRIRCYFLGSPGPFSEKKNGFYIFGSKQLFWGGNIDFFLIFDLFLKILRPDSWSASNVDLKCINLFFYGSKNKKSEKFGFFGYFLDPWISAKFQFSWNPSFSNIEYTLFRSKSDADHESGLRILKNKSNIRKKSMFPPQNSCFDPKM